MLTSCNTLDIQGWCDHAAHQYVTPSREDWDTEANGPWEPTVLVGPDGKIYWD